MNLFNKLIFSFAKPEVIVVCGKNKGLSSDVIFEVLKDRSKIKKIERGNMPVLTGKEEILLIESDLKDEEEISEAKFLLNVSSKFFLVVTNIGDIRFDSEKISGENRDAFLIKEFIKSLPEKSQLIFNADDEVMADIKNKTRADITTFGFSRGSIIKVSDVNLNLEGTNFKINYEGSSVPFRLKKTYGKENIYSILPATAIEALKKINLIEIIKGLANYEPKNGKMKLIEGIKKTIIFDNSLNNNICYLDEAIDIFTRLSQEGRRVAIIGDLFGMGKYTISGYEEIGKKMQSITNILFAVGARTNFITQSAKKNGMASDNIFQFNEVADFRKKAQEEIKTGDFIFIDGSCDIKMGEIVNEIKKA